MNPLAIMAARPLLALAGAGAVFLAGFTAAEVYEHKAPWGLGPKAAARFMPDSKRLWKDEAADLGRRLAAAQRDLGTCRANVGTLDAALTRQGEAVAAWKAESARSTAEAEKAAQRAAQASREAGRAATSILNAKAGKDRCASALAILKGEAG